MNSDGYILTALAVWTAVASLITAGLYAWDKRAAGRATGPNGRRIPERTLLGWSLVGGWPGGWVAGRMLRHKTAKQSYRIRFAVCVALHGILMVMIGYQLWN